jgi:hypothetical protein
MLGGGKYLVGQWCPVQHLASVYTAVTESHKRRRYATGCSQPGGAVDTGGGQGVAVGAEGHREDGAGVAGEGA